MLLAYGKLELKREIVESDAADDPYFERLLVDYFPKLLRRYEEPMHRHRLHGARSSPPSSPTTSSIAAVPASPRG